MNPITSLDLRALPPSQRHPLIFSTFDALADQAAFEIVNDHDPVPLFMQFTRTRGGQFDWQYVQTGPELWQVRITRTQAGQAQGAAEGCCSCACRGGH
jgi:uncharacterized protein (DUF2249 family)